MTKALKYVMRPASEEIIKFLEGVTGVVEATSFETTCLWILNTQSGISWVENCSGYGVTVGTVGSHPVCISVPVHMVKGAKILFWHATSQVVHYELIDEWLKTYLPEPARSNQTDAMNFSNILPREHQHEVPGHRYHHCHRHLRG